MLRDGTEFFRTKGPGFLLTKYVIALEEAKMGGGCFIWELAHKEKELPFIL